MNPQQKACILVVDDLPDNLRTLSAILYAQRYKVRKATSGQIALNTVRSQPPDLILLDIKMPQMDGYEVCSILKAEAETRSIPVIFLSALDETADKVKAFTVGGVDYITKPFNAEEVIARVENQLHLQRLSRKLTEQNILLQNEIRTREQTEVILKQEIGDRKLAEATLQQNAIRLRHQNKVLMELARNPALIKGDLSIALKAIAQAIAENIAVERTSVWLFDSTGNYLHCLELFEKSFNQHSQGAELLVADYPTYFQALIHEQFIVADNAHIAPETKEFSESYLTPLGITSMLDAPIRLGGQTVGVLCSEHVGVARYWTAEDQNFVRSIADLVSLALAAQERQQREEALQESENLYRQMFEANTAIKLVINPESGAIVDANPAASRFYGYQLEELKQMKITDLNVLPSTVVLSKMVHTVSKQQAEFQFRHKLASGEIRDVAVYSSLITREGQQLLYSIIHDITERIQTEEALRHSEARERAKAQELEEALKELKCAQAQLIQTEKMSSLGRMVAGIAHEINNPVSFIYGNLFHLKSYFQDLLNLNELYQQIYPNPSPKIQEFASEIDLDFLVEDWSNLMHSMQVGAERIQEIVLSLKSFSRLDESALKLIDIHEGIDNTLLILQTRLKAVGHRPEIQVIKDYDQLPKITCYASQLNQVFMNLLNNAIDAVETQPEPRIITIHTSFIQDSKRKLTASHSDNRTQDERDNLSNKQSIVILITDNGSGMSKEILHKIFDPFFTTKAVGAGTGLGLSISHQIVVEKHGGQLSCISAPGYGTALIVEIPMLTEHS